jgi:putative addiction module killer protein
LHSVTYVLPFGVIEIRTYVGEDGRAPFARWLAGLDRVAASRVAIALGRLEDGIVSPLKSVGDGVQELRISFGPGYRIYLGREGARLVILLWGGTKQRQSEDIARAKRLWRAHLAERD